MSLASIGEFARLSPKALRLYDELGLLLPAHVDADTGYRWYAATHGSRGLPAPRSRFTTGR